MSDSWWVNNRAVGVGVPVITRRAAIGLLGATALVSACSPTSTLSTGQQNLLPAPTNPLISGEALGTGTVRVGLLLPLSAVGNAQALATSMRNAAQLGLNDFTANDLTVLVKDTQGTPEGAAIAAQAALAEGAEILLGPVFAAEVRSVAPLAAQASVPLVSFSSDPSVAASGSYIMGFTVDDQVNQVIGQASSAGRRSVAAIISEGAYGTFAEAALRQATARTGIRLVQVQRFAPGGFTAAAQAVAANAAGLDAIVVPDGPGIAPLITETLRSSGVDLSRVKLLGSGQWNEPSVYRNPSLIGGWFPAPDIAGFQGFVGRYRVAFGVEPPLTATLAYDAVVLAAGLVKAAGPQRFQRAVLTNPEGFLSSVNGLFRFNADGTNDRGLAIYEVTGSSPQLVQAAPRAFTGF